MIAAIIYARLWGQRVFEMLREVDTSKLLAVSFAAPKTVFVPKTLGRSADDLMMLQTTSVEGVHSFQRC